MRKFILAAGVAALAITVPAVADPGKGDKGRAAAAKVDRGNAKNMKAERVVKADRSEARKANRAEARVGVKARDRVEARRGEIRERRDARSEARREVAVRDHRDWDVRGRARGWDDFHNCPRGLAKKPVPCVPPGQVGKTTIIGQPLRVLSDRVELQRLPNRLRVIYADTPDYYYRYGNGYMYRVNRQNDLISALMPLFGLGLTAGQPFPTAYSNYLLPTGLQAFYPNGSQDYYRYANGYVYEIDGRTGLVEDVDPLLGYGYGYGQMMPATYSAYNVPYQYRSLYNDTSNNYYRYAPGAIYQVDPTTSLITAVAALLTGGMTVGQPLPTGYSAYNVPLAYRANYYDTPDAWYRYSNGNIYQVDPTTQLVTALIAAALT